MCPRPPTQQTRGFLLRIKQGAVVGVVTAVAAAGAVFVMLPAAQAATPTEGTYVAVAPSRILDTRFGVGAPKQIIGAATTIGVQVTGRGGVPATGASAVVLNVTATETTASSYLTVYPSLTPRPTASSINFPANWTGANSVTVKLGTDGKVGIYNNAGRTHIVADVVGYYVGAGSTLAGGGYQPALPERLLDTRTDGFGMLRGGQYITLPVSFGAEYDSHIRALAVNITAVTPVGPGHITTWNGTLPVPETSTINYVRGSVVPNLAIIPVAPCEDCGTATGLPAIGIATTNDTHLVVDIVGFFDDGTLTDGLRFRPLNPTRITDTRPSQGGAGPLGPNTTITVEAPGTVAQDDTYALALNVTGVTPTDSTHLIVWPSDLDQPLVSNLNPARGAIVSNAAITLVGPGNEINVFNSRGSINVVIDVVGSFYYVPSTENPAARAGAAKGSARPQAPELSKSLPGGIRHAVS